MQTGQTEQTEFYVSKGEQTLGPWTLDEIALKIGANEITLTDFIYEESKGDWVPLLECVALREKLNHGKPKVPPPRHSAATPSAATPDAAVVPVSTAMTATTAAATTAAITPEVASTESQKPSEDQSPQQSPKQSAEMPSGEWFVQKGQHRYGPFTYLGIVKALQEKTIFAFDIVWKEGMDQWVRIAEIEDFTPERIRDLCAKSLGESNKADVFVQRQHPRIPFEGEVIVHDNRSVWMGRAYEGSVGGSGLVIENATLVPGQVVLLHFASRDGLPAFNALCEIVSKKFTKEIRDTNSPVSYGVRFIKLDSAAAPKVQEYFEKNATGTRGQRAG